MRILFTRTGQNFPRTIFVLGVALVWSCFVAKASVAADDESRPNIILMMCDDLGWGDTGFNGNTIIKTPHLDKIASQGATLSHFYSVGPVCSPTRASFLTGRHHFRLGIWTANKGHMPEEEITIAHALKSRGYATGHFGKWHLGTLSKTISAKGKGRKPELHFSPPWLRGYDQSFVTESAVQTWDPAEGKRAINNPYYENGNVATENLDGCDSRVLMDRAIKFINESSQQEMPFVAVIWFHAPHEPIMAGPEYLKMYSEHGDAAHYYGCVTAVDDQIGRLRAELQTLGIADNTALFFCSDNGPEGAQEMKPGKPIRRAGSTAGLTGRKRSVYEGGVRVPALAYWPGQIQAGSVIDVPCSTLDYFPTVCKMTGATLPTDRPIDGQDIMPILKQTVSQHDASIPIRYDQRASLVKGRFKLIVESKEDPATDKLFDLSNDRTESNDIAKKQPDRARSMRVELFEFLASAQSSHGGADYSRNDYKPVDPWKPLGQKRKPGKKKNPQ